MDPEPRIEISTERKLVGNRLRMSFSNNRTKELWQGFMPRRSEVRNITGAELYSVEVYDDPRFFENYTPGKEFEKWAAIPVANFDSVPTGMETIIIPEGLYAVFIYKGKASEASKMYRYIFATWIPDSGFLLDSRPHFALMGEKYRNEDPDSEEELWIPLKKK